MTIEDDEASPKSGSMRKLQEIDEQIARYNRTVSKQRWNQIDTHWRDHKIQRNELVSRLQSMLTQDELRLLGIY